VCFGEITLKLALLEYIGTLNTEERLVGIDSNLARPWGGGSIGEVPTPIFLTKKSTYCVIN